MSKEEYFLHWMNVGVWICKHSHKLCKEMIKRDSKCKTANRFWCSVFRSCISDKWDDKSIRVNSKLERAYVLNEEMNKIYNHEYYDDEADSFLSMRSDVYFFYPRIITNSLVRLVFQVALLKVEQLWLRLCLSIAGKYYQKTIPPADWSC